MFCKSTALFLLARKLGRKRDAWFKMESGIAPPGVAAPCPLPEGSGFIAMKGYTITAGPSRRVESLLVRSRSWGKITVVRWFLTGRHRG
jgi:hypothetical protein